MTTKEYGAHVRAMELLSSLGYSASVISWQLAALYTGAPNAAINWDLYKVLGKNISASDMHLLTN